MGLVPNEPNPVDCLFTVVTLSHSLHRNCMQCLHPHNLSQAVLDQCKTTCAVMEQHRVDQASGKCVEAPGAEGSAKYHLLPEEKSSSFVLIKL